jgi:drug/metabolite transporter (DMT)-like permease
LIKYALFFSSLFFLSQSASLVRWAEAPVEVIGFWRMLLACAGLLPLLAVNHQQQRDLVQLRRHDWIMSAASGVFLFAHLWTYFIAAQNTRIANCMIIFNVNPLFVSLGAYLCFQEKITVRLGIAYIFAMIGLYILVAHSLRFERENFKGDMAVLVSALLFAGYILTGRQVRNKMHNISYAFLVYAITVVGFGIVIYAKDLPALPDSPRAWLAIILLAIFPTLLGHAIFSYLFGKIELTLMSCGKLIEPLLASYTAYFLFGERLDFHNILAFLLTASGILILFLPPLHRRIKWS